MILSKSRKREGSLICSSHWVQYAFRASAHVISEFGAPVLSPNGDNTRELI